MYYARFYTDMFTSFSSKQNVKIEFRLFRGNLVSRVAEVVENLISGGFSRKI